MKIVSVNRVMAALAMVYLFTMGAVAVGILRAHDDTVASEQHRQVAHELADELLQSSDDLSRMARSYTATGDVTFEQYYFAILDIRNGVAPRPLVYSPGYWHLAGVGKTPPVAVGEPVSLVALMNRSA